MQPRIDEMVLEVQKWLNKTYGDDSRFNRVEENGRTGWPTIYGLRRALQIEIGIQETSDSFGPTTYAKCPNINQGDEGNLVYIVQGGLWCKGYSPGGFNGYYGNGTYGAVKELKADMGFPTASGNMNRDIMKALLDMSAFVCLEGGTDAIRSIQQQLNYDYYDYYQICPCDGLYNREMNKMLIYALQKELGISKSEATGTWGPTTTSLCKEQSFSLGTQDPIIKLVKYATVCNGFVIDTSTSYYDAELDSALEDFADSLLISKPTNTINYSIIKSLLSSNGDPDRSAKGCDTATQLTTAQIKTLKSNGFEIVGRYLTKVEGGLNKNLTDEEIKRILDEGLRIFPIFQEDGGSNSAFSYESSTKNAENAYKAAKEFGIPYGTTIYFAVDYDPQVTEIVNYIVPYFQGVCAVMSSYGKASYKVGAYGTRNVCNILKQETEVTTLFVLDSSYGFSGNLGFTMPKDWAFDQFSVDLTYGSGSGAVSVDKVAYSGRDDGFSKVNPQRQSDIENVYFVIKDLYELAMIHTGQNVKESNLCVAQYIREKSQSYRGTLWELTGGKLDTNYTQKADERVVQSKGYDFKDPVSGMTYDIYHLMATLSAELYLSVIPGFEDINWEVFDPLVDVFAGWGGDLTTFTAEVKNKGGSNYRNWAKNNICSKTADTTFPYVDYIADIDAFNLGYYMGSQTSIADAFYDYFIGSNSELAKNRSGLYVKQAYGDFDSFSEAVTVFQEGMFPNVEFMDPMKYLKEKLLDGQELPELEYRLAAADAFIEYVISEL